MGVLLLFISTGLHAQTKAQIDSVNNIPFETKIAKAAILDETFEQNLRDAQRISYWPGVANSYSNLSLVYYYQGKYNLNVDYALKAIKIYEAINDKEKQAHEYGGLGYSMKRRNMTNALYYMQKGKSLAESHNLEQPLLSIYNNYGVLKEMQYELDSALYFYKKGLVLKERLNDSLGIPYSLNNIGGIYAMKGDFEAAKKLYDQALKIRILKKDQIGIAENYTCLGDLYRMKNEYGKSNENYQKSLAISLKSQYTFLIQSNYKSLADNFEKLNDQAEAYKNYKLYSQFKDSLLNKETNNKIAELEVRFETNKKEKLLAQQKNLLLQKELEVKQRNILLIAVSLLTIFIAFIGYLIYRQQKLKQSQLEQEHELKTAISQIETQHKLQNQRLSISRDLHDNIGAQLTFIISSVDNLKYAFDLKNTKLDTKLDKISTFTRETIVELRDTIWAMNHAEISFEDLRARILNFIEKAKMAKEAINFLFSIDEDLSGVKLTSIQGMNIYRTIQEALNNALKYADASEIAIEIGKHKNKAEIYIRDNGVGFDQSQIEPGNGMANMQKRIGDIGADFQIRSQSGEGTTIQITLDLNLLNLKR